MFEITYQLKGQEADSVRCQSYTQLFEEKGTGSYRSNKLLSQYLLHSEDERDTITLKVEDLNWIEIKITKE